MRLVVTLLAPVLLASLAGAQVVFTGVIEKATLPSICMEETHFLTCSGPEAGSPTGVLLKSSSLDLVPFEGKLAKFTAVPRGVTCAIYDVVAVDPMPSPTLETCGTAGLGCNIRFRIQPATSIGQYWLFGSTAPAFVPIDATFGTLLIDPGAMFFLKSGPTPPGAFDTFIPADAALTGLDLWFQAARMDIGPVGPIQATNATCFEIPGFVFVCHTPTC